MYNEKILITQNPDGETTPENHAGGQRKSQSHPENHENQIKVKKSRVS